jgi:zinc D-Ala-D-Ala carboxypeptidase
MMSEPKLSAHFSVKEFTDSDTALRMVIDNSLPMELFDTAMKTAELMERIRMYLGRLAGKDIPISISSGYRCPELNRAIGSKDTSDHRKAMAVDFRAPAFGSPLAVCKALEPAVGTLGIGQLIYEHTWIHVSTRQPDMQINRVLTAQGKGFTFGILEA